jgi:two-component system sensor histidine kinase KdpD
MAAFKTRAMKPGTQLLTCMSLVTVVSAACYIATDFIGYRVVALLLLLTVSVLAMLFEMLPVMVAAVTSAMLWNYFFIPPYFTFRISAAEDILLFTMYFIIALVNTVLTWQLRKAEKKAREKEEKEQAIRMYNSLLNSLSHELRTPIATIIGATDTLTDNTITLSPESRAELLQQIGSAGTRLNGQVENLLNMSRIENGMLRVKRDWCDVHELISKVLQKTGAAEHHKLLTEIPEGLPLYRIDTGLTEQLLYNIIINAVQYTPADAQITIRAVADPANFVVVISDNGPGFPEQFIDKAFDKFYRMPGTKTSGTGLGLSIARGFAEAHGGTIRLENNASGGATFTISLPAETSFLNNLKNE